MYKALFTMKHCTVYHFKIACEMVSALNRSTVCVCMELSVDVAVGVLLPSAGGGVVKH